jgi:hypothetical protein
MDVHASMIHGRIAGTVLVQPPISIIIIDIIDSSRFRIIGLLSLYARRVDFGYKKTPQTIAGLRGCS